MTQQPTLQASSTEVRQLMNELLALERPRRERTVRQERFRNLLLGELLVAESVRFEEVCPEKAEELAELARWVADQPYTGALAARVDRVMARSCAIQGNIRRLAGDLYGAEQRFREAVLALTGPPNAVERAFYCQRLACLRMEQGELEEANSLLWRAVGIFREARDMQSQAACLCLLALVAIHKGKVESGRPPSKKL